MTQRHEHSFIIISIASHHIHIIISIASHHIHIIISIASHHIHIIISIAKLRQLVNDGKTVTFDGNECKSLSHK